MPVTFACACGKQLRVADEHAGRRVKCPSCEAVVAVPAPDEVEESVEEDAIQAERRAPRESAPARRPRDEEDEERPRRRRHEDEEEDEAPRPRRRREEDPDAAIQNERPGARGAAARRHPDEEEERPRRKKARKPIKRAVWPWVLAGCGVLLLLSGGGVACWWLLLRGDNVPHLALIPPDAQGFMSTRLADGMKLPSTRQMLIAQRGMGQDPF